MSTDVDEVADLVEVLIHGKGHTPAYIRKLGIDIAVNTGRVGVKRE